MRAWISIILFIAVGLVAAFFVGFRPDLEAGPIHYDEEQAGLSNRIVIKFSHVVAENTPKGLAAIYFAERVKEKTAGRVEIQVFPNGILYTEKNEFAALASGQVQMIAPALSNLSEQFPEFLATDLPFAFPNDEAVKAAFQGKIGQMLFQALERQNIKGMAFWPNGFKQMTSSKQELIKPDDFSGQVFRIMPSKVLAAQFQRLGAKVVPLPFNEVYPHLEEGKVDGEENTISNIYTKRLYQVQNYLTLSNHGYLGYAVLTNGRFWNQLPADEKQAIEEAMAETTQWLNNLTERMNEEQLAQIEASGQIKIHRLLPEERAAWIERLTPLYTEYAATIGPDLVQAVKELQQTFLNKEKDQK
ncbi:TRAP transporter substrate-binding protein [Brevibacillus fulvus]|uniref:C4-dicarboxylate-binding protein DctP n=1 Tax=Brevibacillus fulvus TaxID=1125967 RepID=A0A938Y4F7_9BACL|nr:TRAP transporter substrate-binding protein [Brevibacillus fulvus]MBM7591417.1 C4-dicarboxylate-binding protein DctP [Brevibacillus fulvus]